MPIEQPPAFDLTSRATFPHFVPITIRFADQDSLGHVNNVAIASYLEHGRIAMTRPLLLEFADATINTVLARIAIDYRRELKAPGVIDVGTRVARVGTKSMTLVNGVFQGTLCAATAECVIVFFDTGQRRSVAPPPPLRAELERLAQGAK